MAAVESAVQENEDKDRQDMKTRLEIWDDDESDELFYVDRYVFLPDWASSSRTYRAEWRRKRQRTLAREMAEDAHARNVARAEQERVQRESQMFIEKQMEQIRAAQEEQKKAGLLVDDAAPIRLNVALATKPAQVAAAAQSTPAKPRVVFGQEEEDEIVVKKKRMPMVELDLFVDGEKAKEKLESIRKQVPKEKDALWKAKIRWEAVSDVGFSSLLGPLLIRR